MKKKPPSQTKRHPQEIKAFVAFNDQGKGLVCYLGLRCFRPAWLKTYADASFYCTVALMMLCAFTPLGVGGMTYEYRMNLGFTTLNLVPLLWLTGLLFFGKLLTLADGCDSARHGIEESRAGLFLKPECMSETREDSEQSI